MIKKTSKIEKTIAFFCDINIHKNFREIDFMEKNLNELLP